jgi:hypothetical protein
MLIAIFIRKYNPFEVEQGQEWRDNEKSLRKYIAEVEATMESRKEDATLAYTAKVTIALLEELVALNIEK